MAVGGGDVSCSTLLWKYGATSIITLAKWNVAPNPVGMIITATVRYNLIRSVRMTSKDGVFIKKLNKSDREV
jgi:hypothetical protein